MNPATLHHHDHRSAPRTRRSSRRAVIDELPTDEPRAKPASYSYLEPQGEGILFATFCLISSLLIYCGVLLIRFLG